MWIGKDVKENFTKIWYCIGIATDLKDAVMT
jgi:hypothetical protein